VKVACTVLRGERGCEAPDLPDISLLNKVNKVRGKQKVMYNYRINDKKHNYEDIYGS